MPVDDDQNQKHIRRIYMQPDRRKIIGEHKIEEYYWAGKKVVYIDNRLTEQPFDKACEELKEDHISS